MIEVSKRAALARLALLAGICLTAGCQRGIEPVMPAGQAGYDAVAIDPDETIPLRYTLAPGDRIAVRVYGETELSVPEIVLDNAGVVSLPLIGDVRAIGSTATEFARQIEAAYAAEYLRDPQVTVIVLESRQLTIAVEGEVEQPGVYPFKDGQTLLSALAVARSPTESAKLDEIIIFRTVGDQKLAGRFDLREIRGGRSPDVALVPGDIVVVGFSSSRAAFLDVVRVLPIVGFFRPIN